MDIKVYQAGLKFLLLNVIKRLYSGDVIFHHSLDHGMYATIISEKIIDKKETEVIKKCMNLLIEKNLPINKKIVSKKEAYNFFMKKNNIEKAENVLNVSNYEVSLFELEGQLNYFYSHEMPKTTGELSMFDIYFVSPNEIVLLYPVNGKIDFTFRKKVYGAFYTYDEWLNGQGLDFISDVNKIVAQENVKDLIRKNDIFVDNNLYDIARTIYNEKKKVVMIAGPSSSGKTTTSKKLSLYLSSMGVKAIPISLDDFFKNREETPLDEFGEKDYESINSLDLNLFGECLSSLLSGKEVVLPRYNFILGEKEFISKPLKLSNDEVLVIEGLHGLNPSLVESIDPSLVFKLYISPLTPLNVDRHNYVSTTENRLLRRIVRDYRTRGRSAEATLDSWESVRRGEEKYIFPYTDQSDAILNTAYVYELGILKVYVEPLLYSIKMDSKYYVQARRLLDHLKVIYPISSEAVSSDNLLREFIGGSSFEEE